MRWGAVVAFVWLACACTRGPAARSARDPRQRISSHDGVQRVHSRTGDDWTLIAQFSGAPFSFRWLAIPVRDATHVGLTLIAPAVEGRAECGVRVMVDGVLTPLVLGTPHLVEGEDRLSMTVTVDFVRALAVGRRVAFRVCEDEVRVGPREQAILFELLRRFDEELAWQGSGAVQSITPAQ